MSLTARFEDLDRVVITDDDNPEAPALTCFRTNLDGRWHPVYLGDSYLGSQGWYLTAEQMVAIQDAEARLGV